MKKNKKRIHYEEYSSDFSPSMIPKLFEKENNSKGDIIFNFITYFGLILAIFSIMFYPVTLGSFSIICGIFSCWHKQFAIGVTTIVFATFSICSTIFLFYQ